MISKFQIIFCATLIAALSAQAEQTIRIDGSSTVYPISEAVAEEFQKLNNSINVQVAVSGTGGGFTKFCRGETEISNASRPISPKEMQACREAGIKYIELPVGFDALTVVVNPKNDFVKSLTPTQLKKLWEPGSKGQITSWNQIDPSFPDIRLRLYGPGNNSGTFDYFTEAIVGKAKQSRSDYIASEDDYLIVRGVKRNAGAIGYFGYAYYLENKRKLKAVPIDSGKGAVLPSPETVENGSYTPLSRPIFIYVSSTAIERVDVREFIDYYMKHGARIVKQQNYVPLAASIYALNQTNTQQRRTGTVYAGTDATGVKIEEMLKRPTQN
jgi:phosphate transport system substrate-binding protein